MTLRRVGATVLLVAYGWWVTSLRPFSTEATVAVVAAGVLAMTWGLAHRSRRGAVGGGGRAGTRALERRGLGGWLLIVATLAVWQLAAYLQEPRSAHPTLSSLANAALDARIIRAIVIAAWLMLAIRLAER